MPKKRDFVPENQIRELRKGAGLTLTQIGDELETTATQIARLETGDRELTVNWMRRISVALSLPPADLLLEQDGGLCPEERALIDAVRSSPKTSRTKTLAHLTGLIAAQNS